jgi:Nif-specific regulatory protein
MTAEGGAGFAPHLLATAGGHPGRRYPLSESELIFGRVRTCDVRIADPYASRRHAKIVKRGDTFVLIDLKSRNTTLVNRAPVREHVLQHGDEIQIGDHSFVFVARPDPASLGRRSASVEVLPDADRGRTITLSRRISCEDSLSIGAGGDSAPTPLVERFRQHVEILHRLSEIMAGGLERDLLLQEICDALIRGFAAERACILLRDDESGELASAATASRSGDPDEDAPISQTVVDLVAGERDSILCTDTAADAQLGEARSVAAQQIRSVMATPLILRERLLGIVYLDNRTLPGGFGDDDLALLRTIARQVAVVIENAAFVSGMRRKLEHLQEEAEEGEPTVIGRSAAIRAVVETARKAADSNATILILGESGTGKEVLARSIHRWSGRSQGPFVAVNCAALAEQLLQSDLFGHERGAFTGAVRQKRGRLELADGGTLFLDEIGELAPEVQAKLLRFLQEREFERVGGIRSLHVDVRVIAASNRDLAKEVEKGVFREDLYYRLRVIECTMPPLRKRRGDIPLLAELFLRDSCRETARQVTGFTGEALERLRIHEWPGNVRELRNVVERAVVLGSGPMIEAADITVGQAIVGSGTAAAAGYHEQVNDLKREIIRRAIEQAGGVKAAAAERLGLQPSYLSRLMKNLEMR